MIKYIFITMFTVLFVLQTFAIGQNSAVKLMDSENAKKICKKLDQSQVTIDKFMAFLTMLYENSVVDNQKKNIIAFCKTEYDQKEITAKSEILNIFEIINLGETNLMLLTEISLKVRWGANEQFNDTLQAQYHLEQFAMAMTELSGFTHSSHEDQETPKIVSKYIAKAKSEDVSNPMTVEYLRNEVNRLVKTGLKTIENQKEIVRLTNMALQMEADEKEKYNNPTDKLMWMLSSARFLVYDSVKAFIDHGADLQAMTSNYLHRPVMTPLMAVVKRGNDKLVELMIESGSDLNKTDLKGRTALMLASQPYSLKKEFTSTLITPRRVLEAREQKRNKEIQIKKIDYLKICDRLLKAGANINAVNDRNATALLYAVTYNCLEHVKLLLSNGADVNKGVNPLLYCVKYNYSSNPIATLLINAGIDLNKTDHNGNTALHILSFSSEISYDDMNLINLLIEKGANIDAVNDNGLTALHIITTKNNGDDKSELVGLLLTSGANVMIKDTYGHTALDYDLEYSKRYSKMLKKFGAKRGD